MRLHTFALIAASAVPLLLAQPASGEVQVTMHDGRVSVMAKDATIRQILAEWGRVGQARIVNPDVVGGGPISLQLTDMPEQQALDIILRSASYLAAPRQTVLSNASRFDSIVLMPTSAASPSRSTAAVAPPPAFPQPRPMPVPDDQDDLDVPRNGPPPAPPLAQQLQQSQQLQQLQQVQQQLQQQLQQQQQQRAPVFNTFPPPITPDSNPAAAAPTPFNQARPGPSIGTSAPGMILQPPPQAGQPGQQPGR